LLGIVIFNRQNSIFNHIMFCRHDHDLKRGGLLRCQSHPSGLNIKRGKCRRRTRLSNNRPTLDFAKMKQVLEDNNRSKACYTLC